MQNTSLWKYCTSQHCKEMICSFELLGKHNQEMSDGEKDRELACLYAVSNHTERHYHFIQIPKKDHTFRKLLVPDPLLKQIQRNILHNVLETLPVSPYATAYLKGAGIVKNASRHTGKDQILKLDLKDFFSDIRFDMIYRTVFRGELFPPPVRSLLTYLCCYRDYLPQGAPISPAVSNLVMKSFDDYMGQWCEKQQIRYTRYCDDMTYSGSFDAVRVRNKARSFLEELGFTLNDKKTRILTKHVRQSVTGIVVNHHPQVSRAYRMKLRQEIYYCRKFGVKSHLEQKKDNIYLPGGEEGIQRYLQSLLGKVNYILQVNPADQSFLSARECVRDMMGLNIFRGFAEAEPGVDVN